MHHVMREDDPLPSAPFVLRLKYRIWGGVRKHLAADVGSKGVPESVVQEKVDAILQHMTPEQLTATYRALEPWIQLKQLIGTKVRLVTQQETKDLKAKNKGQSLPSDTRQGRIHG